MAVSTQPKEQHCLNQIYYYSEVLHQVHNRPNVFVHHDGTDVETCGSQHLKNKIDAEIETDPTWMEVASQDVDDMVEMSAASRNGPQLDRKRAYYRLRSNAPPKKLPFPVQYLGFDYLRPYVTKEIVKSQQRQYPDEPRTRIAMRDPEFHAEWWPQDVWAWEETVNFKDKKAAFPGRGEFTEFLKQCVIRILGFYGLNPDEHVIPQMDAEALNRKKRNRGHPTAPQPHDDSSNGSNNSSHGSHDSVGDDAQDQDVLQPVQVLAPANAGQDGVVEDFLSDISSTNLSDVVDNSLGRFSSHSRQRTNSRSKSSSRSRSSSHSRSSHSRSRSPSHSRSRSHFSWENSRSRSRSRSRSVATEPRSPTPPQSPTPPRSSPPPPPQRTRARRRTNAEINRDRPPLEIITRARSSRGR